MTNFILAWVLVSYPWEGGPSYSPPVQTLADCQRIQAEAHRYNRSTQCVQINVLRGMK